MADQTPRHPAVQITVAHAGQRTILENLFQLYVHDFSEQWGDRPEGELGEDGRFELYDLKPFWTDPDRIPLLLRSDGKLIGCALLDRHGYSGQALDRNMGEFFIVRKYRRGGYGLAAAHAIFDRLPGQWEAAVAHRNTAALAFWRKAAGTHPAVHDIQEIDPTTDAWNGPVIRFRID